MLVLVVSADDHRHEVSLSILLGIGVHHPLVARRRYVNRASRAQIVYAEGGLVIGIGVVERDHDDADVLVVEVFAGIDLDGLGEHLAGIHSDGARVGGERQSVDQNLGALRVRSLVKTDVEVGISCLGLFALVGEVGLEACGFAVGHAAHAALVELHLRVLNLLGALIEDGAWTVEERSALTLVRSAGGSATCAIDEAACIADVLHVELALQIGFVVVHQIVEVVLGENIHHAGVLHVVGAGLHAIDIEVDMALAVHGDSKALLAVELFRLRVLGHHVEGHGRRERELERGSKETNLHAVVVLSVGRIHSTSRRTEHTAKQLGHDGTHHLENSPAAASRIKIVNCSGRDGAGEGVHAGILAGEVLAIANARTTVHAEVLHELGGFEFLLLVLGNHLHPCLHGVVEVGHFVLAIGLHVRGQDNLIAVALGTAGSLAGVVEVLAVVEVDGGKLVIVGLEQRQIDGLARDVGLRLCLSFSASEHQ